MGGEGSGEGRVRGDWGSGEGSGELGVSWGLRGVEEW